MEIIRFVFPFVYQLVKVRSPIMIFAIGICSIAFPAIRVFKMENVTKERRTIMDLVVNELGLTAEQTRLLFSCQYAITLHDINNEKDEIKKILKKRWLDKWKRATETYLSKKLEIKTNYKLQKNFSKLISEIKKEIESLKTDTPLYLILMETTFFTPYYQLSKNVDESLKKLKLNKKEKMNVLYDFADALTIDKKVIERYDISYKKAIKGLTKYRERMIIGGLLGAVIFAVTAGFSAPMIASMFATQGLSGAAAITSGLAAIGGGAVAAGGLGMSTGVAVVVGGGVVLGTGTGMGAGYFMRTSPDFALLQAAKFEVFIKEIKLNILKDIKSAQELIQLQKNVIKGYEKEYLELSKRREKNKKEIRFFEKTLRYLKIACSRNERNINKAVTKE